MGTNKVERMGKCFVSGGGFKKAYNWIECVRREKKVKDE